MTAIISRSFKIDPPSVFERGRGPRVARQGSKLRVWSEVADEVQTFPCICMRRELRVYIPTRILCICGNIYLHMKEIGHWSSEITRAGCVHLWTAVGPPPRHEHVPRNSSVSPPSCRRRPLLSKCSCPSSKSTLPLKTHLLLAQPHRRPRSRRDSRPVHEDQGH